jgi:hypothetical protein
MECLGSARHKRDHRVTAMDKSGVLQDSVASAVASAVTEPALRQGHADGGASRIQGRRATARGGRSEELRAKKQDEKEKGSLELQKLRRDDEYERKKNTLELERLQREAAFATERNQYEVQKFRRESENGQEKNDLEMRKLRDETKNARWSQYFELGKGVVPALSIIASVAIAANSIEYQRDKDRSVDVSKQLVHFQDQITVRDVIKQRNAIAAVRALRKDAIPSLLANLDVDHSNEVLMAVHAAILELDEDVALQQTILRELLNSMKYVALRPNVAHLEYYLALWSECLRQFERTNNELFQQALVSADRLATDLNREIQAKIWDQEIKDDVTAAIKKLQSQRRGP